MNEAGLPHLEALVVAGPYNPTGSGDTPSREKIFSCKPKQTSEEVACARGILSKLARQAYRRPVTDRDLEPLLSFYQASRNRGGNFDQGVESGIRMILSDPQFVFRFEPEPANISTGTVYRISDTELASRLAYFLWSSLPDEQLLGLATQSKLHETATLEQQVRRMLADPKADALVDNFASQWLYLRNMKNTFPDPQEFPNFRRQSAPGFAERDIAIHWQHLPRRSQRDGPSRCRLHVRQRAGRAALRNPRESTERGSAACRSRTKPGAVCWAKRAFSR